MTADRASDVSTPCGPAPRLRRLRDGVLLLAAPAKINLNLLVGPRRADGFHDLDSYVAKVTLYDFLRLAARDDGRLVLRCTGADCGPEADNLALRAAGLLAAGREVPGATIELDKRIPPGSGLGGGSSDAAAALVGLNELWRLDMPGEALTELAALLCSDVPLFLGPSAARMTGRGERLEPIPLHPFWAALVLPGVACPTAKVYEAFDRLERSARRQPDAAILSSAPSRWRGRLCNELFPAACEVCPALAEIHRRLADALDVPVSLTGSGSAMFALCDTLAEAQAVAAAVPADLRSACRIVVGNDW